MKPTIRISKEPIKQESPSFDTVEEATEWMYEEVDDICIDNVRFAFNHDTLALEKYEQQCNSGCCGSFDKEIIVNGLLAKIGCNYGH